jgi:fructose-bisphosphate aldolase class II
MKDAFFRKLTEDLSNNPKVLEPSQALPGAIEAAKTVIRHKMDLFNDADRVKYYNSSLSPQDAM